MDIPVSLQIHLQYHFSSNTSVSTFPIPVTMPPFTKLRIFDSLNFVVLFFTVCLAYVHLFPKCFWVFFLGHPPCWVLEIHRFKKADTNMFFGGAYSLVGKTDTEHKITNMTRESKCFKEEYAAGESNPSLSFHPLWPALVGPYPTRFMRQPLCL